MSEVEVELVTQLHISTVGPTAVSCHLVRRLGSPGISVDVMAVGRPAENIGHKRRARHKALSRLDIKTAAAIGARQDAALWHHIALAIIATYNIKSKAIGFN